MTAKNSVPWYSRWRVGLVSDLKGDVLEIGVGAGENLAHYRHARVVQAIEPDFTRALRARRSAFGAYVPVHIEQAPAEALPYRSHAFDHIVSSLVFCSVSDPHRALTEVERVLRPHGTLHMVEHVRPNNPLLATIFAAATPCWSRIAHNCHLDRPTVDFLRRRGWNVRVHGQRAVFVHISATFSTPL